MHSLLQKLGKEINRADPINNRRFLTEAEDICDVLTDNTGTKNTLAMYLNMSKINEPLSMDENSFQRMRNLKLLHFYKGDWKRQCMPFNFRAESLVEIRMEYSKLEKLWEGTQVRWSILPTRLGYGEVFNKSPFSNREAFSAPIRGFATHVRIDSQSRISHAYDLDRKPLDPHMHRSDRFKTEKKQNTYHDDLRFRISAKRESLARTVWNRLDHSPVGIVPRDWERYHPYQKDLRADSRYTKRTTETPIKQGRYGDSASSSSWRVKGSSPQKQNRVQERSRE
ncbi:hypothetical protein F2Q69_00012489 [Brassica cretica]|uniref:Uncharacterized protein n=1 Tax=Brassica cretica TaxID=69181 RepID=A0A8S9R625_BRACR|nr:hypothetical protein F2Q69_00012489 [Brassica cretica]